MAYSYSRHMFNMCYNQLKNFCSFLECREKSTHTSQSVFPKGQRIQSLSYNQQSITTTLPEYSDLLSSALIQLSLDYDIDHLLRLFTLFLPLY